MATATLTQTPKLDTLADLLACIGHVPPERIRLQPPPGTATEKDVLDALEAADKRLFELVDGVLVEKPMGYTEATLAVRLGRFLDEFLDRNELGVVSGPDGPMRLMEGLVRFPDVAFVSWERLRAEIPKEPIPDLAPELAIEIISAGNTPQEMKRKLADYFGHGVEMVWFIYPKTQTAEVYTSPTKKRRLGKEEALSGGDILPGFSLPLKKLFARLYRKRSS